MLGKMKDKGEIMIWNYFKGYVIVVCWNNCIGILKLYRSKNDKEKGG